MLSTILKVIARLGTGVCLTVLVWSCAQVPGLREETSSTFIRIPFVRVLLDNTRSRARVSSHGSFAIECIYGGKQSVYFSSREAIVSNNRGRLEVKDNRGALIEEHLDEVNIIPRGQGSRVILGDREYRGLIKFHCRGENLQVVNVLYMEDYLRGVVPPEIGRRAEDEVEAVKAQAVAARTYAMAHLQQYPNEPYDMKSSIMDQVYEGVRVENRLVNKAIDATAGYVITHNDKFIQAYYHSTCGGFTDDIADVWDRQEIPYLKPVSDSGACSWSKYYTWTETFTEPQVRSRVEAYLSQEKGRPIKIGKVLDIMTGHRSPGGRVAVLSIRTENDVYKFYRDRIRWVLKRSSNSELILPSDRFEVSLDRDSAGRIRTASFRGRGYGHGVGMCQCGAIGLAREGWDFDSILSHYYVGAAVKKLF